MVERALRGIEESRGVVVIVAPTPAFGVCGSSLDSRFRIRRHACIFEICVFSSGRAADLNGGSLRYTRFSFAPHKINRRSMLRVDPASVARAWFVGARLSPSGSRVLIAGQAHAVNCQPAPALLFGGVHARVLSAYAQTCFGGRRFVPH